MNSQPVHLDDNARILIVKPSSLGDIATALPLLCDIKARFPASRVDWLIQPMFADLVRGHDAVNRVILFDRAKISRCWRSIDGHIEFRGLYRQLRQTPYQLAIDAQGLFRSSLFCRLSGAPQRIGFADAREGATRFYTHRVNIPRGRELAVVRMRHLFSPLGTPSARAEFRMPVQPAAREKIRSLLPAGRRIAVVIPGARWHAKRWSELGYAEIVHRLEVAGVFVVVTGSPAEKELCQQVAAGGTAALNLAGNSSLAEMVALIVAADILVGNDSGPLHVAAASGTPLVGLYGPTDPASVGPYGQMDHVLRFDDIGDYRDNTLDRNKSLDRLPVETVWNLVSALLAAGNTRNSQ